MGKFVILNSVKSEKNLVDHLTKGLSRNVDLELSREMSLSLLEESINCGNPAFRLVSYSLKECSI